MSCRNCRKPQPGRSTRRHSAASTGPTTSVKLTDCSGGAPAGDMRSVQSPAPPSPSTPAAPARHLALGQLHVNPAGVEPAQRTWRMPSLRRSRRTIAAPARDGLPAGQSSASARLAQSTGSLAATPDESPCRPRPRRNSERDTGSGHSDTDRRFRTRSGLGTLPRSSAQVIHYRLAPSAAAINGLWYQRSLHCMWPA
jgi:hypothetical protein